MRERNHQLRKPKTQRILQTERPGSEWHFPKQSPPRMCSGEAPSHKAQRVTASPSSADFTEWNHKPVAPGRGSCASGKPKSPNKKKELGEIKPEFFPWPLKRNLAIVAFVHGPEKMPEGHSSMRLWLGRRAGMVLPAHLPAAHLLCPWAWGLSDAHLLSA